MCGRFAQFSPIALMREAFEIRAVKCDPVLSYNIAPSQEVPVVIYDNERLLTKFFWGISSAIYKQNSKPLLLVNARLETIAEKPTFREAYRYSRCLIPADGFYEWEKAMVKKQPWFFKAQSNLPFAFGGIWVKKREKDEPHRSSFAIITTDATGSVSKIHDRMPVILNRNAYESWLNPALNDPKKLKEIIKEGALRDISGYPVSRRVNSVSNNDPSCIEPVNSELQQKKLI